jgi:hypothetical protein
MGGRKRPPLSCVNPVRVYGNFSGFSQEKKLLTRGVMSPTLFAIALHAFELHAAPSAELPAVRAARLRATAVDAVRTVEGEAPLPGMSREQTLRVLVATALVESAGLQPAIDRGVKRGDHGRSVCLMQINVGAGRVQSAHPVVSSWRAGDLLADRRKCFAAGLDAARWSVNLCRGAGLQGGDQLSAYVSGRCTVGLSSARHRWHLASTLVLASVRDEVPAVGAARCEVLDAALDSGPLLHRPFPG